MAEQTALVEHYQEIIDAEQFLMLDDENHDDPLFDLYVDDLQEPHGTDFSGTHLDENINNQDGNFNIFPENPGFGNPIQIPIWPVQPSPHSCTCCQTLREFFHINGTNVAKLDIHGRIGIISHAVLERYNDASSENHEYHMFDFCHESLSSVKQFLIKYCNDRKREGYIMLQDPLSYFYDTLCIGLDSDTDMSPQQTSIGEEDGHMNQEDGLNQIHQEGNRTTRVEQTKLAPHCITEQRERMGKMKLKDLAQYFHLPINEAASKISLCSSAIKSICRKEGLKRWPYRKIKSFESRISQQKKSLSSNDANERERALTEINRLQQILATCYESNWLIDLV